MSSNCCGAEKLFDVKTARKELKKYKKSGPDNATNALIRLLQDQNIHGQSLLDIGGGIGAIQWYFLKNGSLQTTDVDYSDGYLEVAKEYASENGWEDKTDFRQGDFLDISTSIENHDYVTLDKVVCCYPDYQGLLSLALSKSKKGVGLVYPMGGYIAKAVAFLMRIFLRLSGNTFRPYIHPVNEIRQLVLQEGFENASTKVSFPWHVEVYKRV